MMANKQVRLTPAETKLIEVIRTFEIDPIKIRNYLIMAQIKKESK